MKTEKLFGYPVSLESTAQLAARISCWRDSGEVGRWFACLNPHSLELSERDSSFKKSLMEADFIVPDGTGIVFASRSLGGRISQRVTGYDIFEAVNRQLAASGIGRVFFLGSSADVLAKIANRFADDYPTLDLVGTYSPPYKKVFDEVDTLGMIDAINAARPDVVWVGMTAPKQEKWIAQHISSINAGFVGPVGAVFDFYAGTVRRSHPVFQRLGLEWLPRLVREPRRLWYRNFVSTPRFLLRIVWALLRGRRVSTL